MPQPGSGALNAGYAVTYGDLGETNRMNLVNLLDRQNEERQQRLQEQQKADAAHKFALQKYYGTELDPSKYQTETPLDNIITPQSNQAIKDISDLIYNGASDQDIESAVNQKVGELQKTYQIGTSIKRNIDNSLEGLKGVKGIDQGALKLNTNLNIFYKKDPKTGKLVEKSPEEIRQLDPEHNYAADILLHNPQLVSKGGYDYNGTRGRFSPVSQEISGEHYTAPGVKSKKDFKVTLLDGLQYLDKDDNGVMQVKTVSDPIIVKDANGKEIKIDAVPQSVLNTMQKDPGERAALDVDTQKWLAEHYPNQPQPAPGTEDFEKMKAIMTFQKVQGFNAKAISDKQSENRSGLRVRLDLGGSLPGEGGKGTDGDKNADVSASFNDITNVHFVGDNGVQGTIKDGKFVPNKMNKFFGTGYKGGEIEGTIPLDQLPLSVRDAVVRWSQGNHVTGEKFKPEDINDADGNIKDLQHNVGDPKGVVKVRINDGVVTGVMTDSGQWFDVGSRQNSNIKLENSKTTMKNKQSYKLPDATQPKKDPLGLF